MISNFLIPRLGASFPTPYPRFKFIILHWNSFLFFNSFTSQTPQREINDDNFTVSYLTTSCGLSPKTAARLSKKVKLKTSANPNAVLALLKNYGFSESQIAQYVQKRPAVLLVKAEKTLLPKLMFFHSIGISATDIQKLLLTSPTILRRSLKQCLIPTYELIRSVVRNDEEAVRALKRWVFSIQYCDVVRNLEPNMNVLRECGVPQASISHLVMSHPGAAFVKHSMFVEAVKFARELGFNPSKVYFVNAVRVHLSVGREKFELRLDAFKKWGWSHEVSLSAYRKYPTFMSLTEERITRSMNFLVHDMGWPSQHVADFPEVLAYNFEKRTIPRCVVIKILKSKGLVKSHLRMGTFMHTTDEMFLKNFVTRFLKDVPLLLDVYQGLIDGQHLIYSCGEVFESLSSVGSLTCWTVSELTKNRGFTYDDASMLKSVMRLQRVQYQCKGSFVGSYRSYFSSSLPLLFI